MAHLKRMLLFVLMAFSLALWPSVLEAQLLPSDCIKFVYRDDSTTVALEDTCAGRTIWIGAIPASGSWVFEADNCIEIDIRVGRYYQVTDTTEIRPGRWQYLMDGDSVYHPAKDSISTRMAKDPDTLSWRYTCAGEKASYVVSLGCWDQAQVTIPGDTSVTVCDSIFTYPVPVRKDSSWLIATAGQMAAMKAAQLSQTTLECDTSRITPTAQRTITGTQRGDGTWFFNLRERLPGEPRSVPVGWLPGASDTCMIRYSIILSFFSSASPGWHDSTWVDTTRQIVNINDYRDPRYAAKINLAAVNCGQVVLPKNIYTYEPVFIPNGQDSVVTVNTLDYKCPKFTVDCQTERLDTAVTITETYVLLELKIYIEIFDQLCRRDYQMFRSIDSSRYKQPFYGQLWNTAADSAYFQFLKATFGCDSAAGRVPVLDSIAQVSYDPGTYQPIDTIWTAAKKKQFMCHWDSLTWYQYYLLDPNHWKTKWCWLPESELQIQGGCQPTCVSDINWNMWYDEPCCRKDSTVYFLCKDPVTGAFAPDSITWEVPLYPCDNYSYWDSVTIGFDTLGVRSDTARIITRVALDPPIFTITVEDTCNCTTPSIKTINGTVALCPPLEIVNACPGGSQPWFDDGKLVLDYSCGVTINGRWGLNFWDIVEAGDLMRINVAINKRIDSLRNYYDTQISILQSCCTWSDSLQILRTQVDSLEAELAACCASKPDFYTVTLDGDGNGGLGGGVGVEGSIVLVSYMDNAGTAGDDPPSAYWDGSSWKIIGAADRKIAVVIKVNP